MIYTSNKFLKKILGERTGLFENVKVNQRTAEKKGMILIDNYAYWEEVMKNRSEINVSKEWLNDPLHPNGAGHLEIARLMFKELSIFNSKDTTCNGKYYEGKH